MPLSEERNAGFEKRARLGLREEFEPVLISPHGLHFDAELCRRAWEDQIETATKHQPWQEWEEVLRGEIAKADEWLRLCHRTKHINKRTATSYGLKHIVEDWWIAKHGGNGYLCNGCFLMAAYRLGFQMKGAPGRYCFKAGFVWDCFNAWINISSRDVPIAVDGLGRPFYADGADDGKWRQAC
jgi:hypothetical protein